jgi:hypothetical protein
MNRLTKRPPRTWRANILCVLCGFFIIACSDQQPPKLDYFAKSPKGITFRSNVPIPSDVLTEADRQIDHLLERAAAHGLTDVRRHGAISIRILPRAAQCQTAGFLVSHNVQPGTNYDGSEYDLDPRPGVVSLCASGRYLEREDLIQVTLDGVRTMPIVRYEGEHWILYHADRQFYERTKIHHAGNLHPILGD